VQGLQGTPGLVLMLEDVGAAIPQCAANFACSNAFDVGRQKVRCAYSSSWVCGGRHMQHTAEFAEAACAAHSLRAAADKLLTMLHCCCCLAVDAGVPPCYW
jgi:hypothetical protein